jgi:hypothetical protein
MVKHTTLYRLLLLASIMLILATGLAACGQKSPANEPAPTPAGPTGGVSSTPLTVLSITGGNVLVMKPGGQWTKGEEGMTLGADDSIRTGAGGRATITFFEGSTIELDSGTEIRLAELGMAGTTNTIRLEQNLGQTISRVKKLVDPASSYEIGTTAAVASVRGTTMYVGVDEEQKTTVGNIEGSVAVTAGGVEVILPEGTHTDVEPGQIPGPIQPDPTPLPAGTPTSTPTKVPEPTPPVTTAPANVKISLSKACEPQTAYPGDTIAYTYTVGNAGDVPLANISVTDDHAGPVAYTSGDASGDKLLDTGETWIFRADYVIKAGETGQLINTAVATGTGPDNQKATASATATVNVLNIIVKITSLDAGEKVGRDVVVSGTVNDPSITRATIKVNESSREISVADGKFSAAVSLEDGENVITVTVTKAEGITASTSVTLEPEPS